MARKRYSYHPACLLFPKLTEDELQALADDIRERGLLNPIILLDGKILDGRNRLAACKIAGVEPTFVDWDGEGSPVEWVISQNLFRRHLSSSQRAVIALEVLPMLEKEAKARQRLSKGRGIKVGKKLPTLNGKASEAAARITKSNENYVKALKAISTSAPELIEEVRSGVVKVGDARKLAALSRVERKFVLKHLDGHPASNNELRELIRSAQNETRQRAAKRFAGKYKSPRGQGIVIGDLDLLWKRLDDDSVDLFLTDPPYADIESYGRLAELASAKLKAGGLCLAYSGQMHLPRVVAEMGKHLKWWWMFSIRFGGQHCAIHPRHVQNKWKPILGFAKPPVTPAPQWLSDMLQGAGRDKEHHEWGQDESEVSYLVRHLTEPGDLVVDPFCGGGTIPVVCKELGRRWLATEIDKDTALVARKRVAES